MIWGHMQHRDFVFSTLLGIAVHPSLCGVPGGAKPKSLSVLKFVFLNNFPAAHKPFGEQPHRATPAIGVVTEPSFLLF